MSKAVSVGLLLKKSYSPGEVVSVIVDKGLFAATWDQQTSNAQPSTPDTFSVLVNVDFGKATDFLAIRARLDGGDQDERADHPIEWLEDTARASAAFERLANPVG